MTCPNCNRLERLLYATMVSNAAALTSAGLQGVGVPAGFSEYIGERVGEAAAAETIKAGRKVTKKARKKVSAYQKELGRQLEKLKKKHPRTPMKDLMSRAHAATKKEMKKR